MTRKTLSAKAPTARRMRRRRAVASVVAAVAAVAKAGKPAEQLALVLPVVVKSGRGGARPGSGRKRAYPQLRRNASHRPREAHAGRSPVHVTMRAAKGLPSFRHEVVQRLLKEALGRQSRRDYGTAFQIVHFSIQHDHLHLVAEAQAPDPKAVEKHPRLVSQRAKQGLETKERDMLRRGIAGFAISFARQLNKLLGRKGKVWGDRHHRRELRTPTDVRNTLLYVFQNIRRHGGRAFGPVVDRFSTAPTFDGWSERNAIPQDPEPWRPPPRTWLLARGWLRGGGPLSAHDGPALSPRARVAAVVRDYVPETELLD